MARIRFTRRASGPTLEIALTLVAILVAVGWWLVGRPIQLDPLPDDTAFADSSPQTARADVLVVLPTVAEALTLDQLSTDEGWLNLVEQEVGPFRTVDTSALSRSVMDASALVIIPRRAASQLDPTQTQFVRNWVEDGGTAIVEQPEGPWRGVVGQAFNGARYRDTRRITSFDGAIARGELRADILEMPLRTTLLPYSPPNLARGRDYQVLLEVDGQPGIVGLNLGRGHVILVLFDFGRAITLTQQGQPNPDFSIRRAENDPRPATVGSTEQLVIDPALTASAIPFIDLLERNLLYLADTNRPLARLWYYPATYRGALLVGHSEARFGNAVSYMPEWEHSAEERSTTFAVATSLSPETLARFSRTSADVQLQWVPVAHPAVPQRTWGIRGFRPVRRAMNLEEQQAALNHDLIPYGPVSVSRTIDGLWSPDYFDAFRRLTAAGVQLDVSYGPSPATLSASEESIGYLFGTGLPFRPLDRTGHRFPLWELPVSVDAAANGYTLARVRQLIVDSSEGYHTTIAGDWRPDVMTWRPSFDALEGWRQAFSLARSQELWVTTYSEYAEFLQRRSMSTLTSEFSVEQRRLTIAVEAIGPERGRTEVELLTPALAFPARYEGRPVERLIIDGELQDAGSLGLTGDRVLHLLPLTPGEHRVQVVYGSPLDPVGVP
ncbi:MAG: hypothetical protein ACI81R_000540 [Bradymonadia bacterium]|jgi:hypothetical protein